MTEPLPDYSDYFDHRGQPVRRAAQLTEDEEREYELYAPLFGTTTPQPVTKETPA